MPELARPYRVAAVDLRGYGDSDRPEDGYDVATQAADIADTIEALGATSARIVAQDMAAPSTLYLARTRPELVSHLVYLDEPVHDVGFTELTSLASPLGQPLWWFSFHTVPDLPETLIIGREAEYVAWFHRAVPTSLRQYAAIRGKPKIAVPVLGLGGDHSLGGKVADWLRGAGDDVTGGSITDCGHFPPEEQPGPLLDRVLPFLRT